MIMSVSVHHNYLERDYCDPFLGPVVAAVVVAVVVVAVVVGN